MDNLRYHPLHPNKKVPILNEWQNIATSDAGTLATWKESYLWCNWGIATGKNSGVVVIDVDPRNGGDEKWKELTSGIDIPKTVEVQTVSGGRHLYFSYPSQKIPTMHLNGVDIQSDGAYVVAAGSEINGVEYVYLHSPAECNVEPLPQPLLERLIGARKPKDEPKPVIVPTAASKGNCEPLLRWAERYAAKASVVNEGGRNAAAFNLSGHLRAGITQDGTSLSDDEIQAVMKKWNATKCTPPLGATELNTAIWSSGTNGTPRPPKLIGSNDQSDVGDWGKLELETGEEQKPSLIVPLGKFCKKDFALKPVIIEGLLRKGELCNVVAAPKTGKSWASLNLALSIASGNEWFGRICTKGKTLIIDNELEKNNLNDRMNRVCNALAINRSEVEPFIDIMSLRGNIRDIHQLWDEELKSIQPDTYSCIIIDSLYRALPKNVKEIDNSDITQVYNTLDRFAHQLNSAIVCIHHTSKGIQGSKGITDVGSGAGAQSRAVDTHIALRPHEEENVLVIDAVVRSFPVPTPTCWKWENFIFTEALGLNPKQLKKEGSKASTSVKKMTPADFTKKYVKNGRGEGVAEGKETIIRCATDDGMTRRDAEHLFSDALANGCLEKISDEKDKRIHLYVSKDKVNGGNDDRCF